MKDRNCSSLMRCASSLQRLFFLALLSIIAIGAYAQGKTVSGTVLDKSGESVIGASVVVKGTTNGTITDFDGKFTLSNVPNNASLEISFVGYKTQVIPVQGKTTFNVTMAEDTEVLDEVVVVGYGVQKKSDVTGAMARVTSKVIEDRPVQNALQAMQGKVTGVDITSNNRPGELGEVRIRGNRSITANNDPLYVIDGIPMTAGSISDINPSDIESMEILKDASATAIYGSRGANGVILVTTKKGKEGKMSINLDIKQGFVSMGNHNMDYANAQESMNLFAHGRSVAYGNTYDESYDYLKKVYQGYGWDGVSSYDWMDAITRKGYYQDYNVNLQGRSGSTGYYVSLGYLDTEGLIIGSDMKRYSGRLNLDSKFSCFTIGVNASYSNSTQNGFSQATSGSMSSATVAAISSMNPMMPFYNEDGSYANISNYNPLALYDEKAGEINENNNQTLNFNPYLQIDLGKGIYAKTTLGVNINELRQYQYWSALYNPQAVDYNGLGQQYNSRYTTITWNNVLGWNYTFDKHNINLLLGQEMQRKNYFYEYYSGSDFPFAADGKTDLSTAGTPQGSEYYKKEARLASYFMDAHYSYEDKYYVSGSFRRDGSSVFGSNHRWGNFWSVGGKWRVSGEEFLKDNSIITNATLRASYGTVGNQDIDWYAARGFYSSGYNYNEKPGMTPTSISNSDLTWETSKKFDIGFDLSLINRIHLTFDYYNEETSDALFEVPLSMTTGMSTVYQNIGAIRNRGIEASINASVINNNNLTWNIYANMTWNKNKIIKLSTDEPIEYTYQIIEEGRPYRQFYMKEYAGVDRENGKPLWYLNEEGNETTSDYNAAAKRYVGDADPKVLGGFGTNLSWKGFDFNMNFTYRLGGKVFDSGASFTGFGMANRTPLKDVALNSWTEENKDAKYPQYIYGDPNKATQTSSRFLYSSNFLRISNMTLGYTVPVNLTKKIFIQKLRAYISIDNLYTFTSNDFVGYNPETYSNGVIAWQYPATRTFIGGIQLSF